MEKEDIMDAIGGTYLKGRLSKTWIEDKFCIMENLESQDGTPLQNDKPFVPRLRFPLKATLTFSVFCRQGRITIRIQQKDYVLEAGGILVIFGGQILENIELLEDTKVIIVAINSEYIMSEMRGPHGRSLRQWLLHNQEPALVSIPTDEADNYDRLCQSLKFIVKNSEGDWIAADTKRDYLRVSPDRLFYADGDKHTKRNLRILECKTTSVSVDPDDFPVYWYCQLQYQMGVMGVKKGAVAWISSYPRLNFGYKEFDFNPEFYKALVEAIEHFWLINVCGGIAPDDLNSEDTLLKHPTATVGETVEADAELIDVYNNLKTISNEISALENSKSYLEDRIKIYMGDAETLVSPTGTVMAQWKNTKVSQKFNAKAFLEDDPAGYAKYLETTKPTRRFSVK